MKAKASILKTVETLAGAAVGAATAGPLGAVAGGLAARHIHSDIEMQTPVDSKAFCPTDPLIHAQFKRILVPLDFSEPSITAVRFANTWGDLFGSEIYLLHVNDRTTTLADFGTVPTAGAQGDLCATARTALKELSQRKFGDSLRVFLEVQDGVAHDESVAAARELESDIIIMTTHGHSGLSRSLLGSTTERVVRHAPCSILTLRLPTVG